MVVARSQSRNLPIGGLPTPQSAVTNDSRSALRRPLRTTLRPSSTFLAPLPTGSGHIIHNTTTDSLRRRRLLNDSPKLVSTQETGPSPVTGVQRRWCINMFCDRHRESHVYETCDGWKRHMKEHETVWLCMPYGPLEITDIGPICALCGSMKPSKSHMASHSIGGCGDTSTKLRGVSRRGNLEKHLLRSHAVTDECARNLANKWKRTLHKKKFSCGFCVSIFSSIHDQLNHIDMDHFKNGQQITQWSATNIIRGLLLSPSVASWFQYILLSDPYAINRDLSWDWYMIEHLQRRLEIAEDAPETLAYDAYQMLAFNLSRHNSDGQHPPTSLSGLNSIGQSEVAIAPFAILPENLENNSEHQIGEFAQIPEHPWYFDEHDAAAPDTNCSWTEFGRPMNLLGISDAQPSMHYRKLHPVVSRDLPTVSASSTSRSGSASGFTDLSSISAYDSPGTTTSSTLHSVGAIDTSREQHKTHPGPTHRVDTDRTPTAHFDDLAHSFSLETDSFPLDTHDHGHMHEAAPSDKLKQYRDINLEPTRSGKVMMQNDTDRQMELLTCDPRDLVKELR